MQAYILIKDKTGEYEATAYTLEEFCKSFNNGDMFLCDLKQLLADTTGNIELSYTMEE